MVVPSRPDLQIELQERLRFETLVADISARFVNVPADQVDSEIEAAQRRICESLKIEHSSLWQAAPDMPGALILTHLYRDPDLPPAPDRMFGPDSFPWIQAQGMTNGMICIADTSKLPPEAAIDRENCRKYSIKATIGFPLVVGRGPVFGAIGFEAIHEPRDWPEPLQKRLLLIAQIFANALDRKRSEQKLRESEARLSLAAASANAGLWTLDPDTGQIWATDKTYELLGIPVSAAFNVETFLAVLHSEDREVVRRAIQNAMESGKESSSEYRVMLADGNVRWIASHGCRQGGNNGQPIRLMGVNIDITKSKLMEQELKVFRDRLQAESDYLREEVRVTGKFDEIIGQSKPLKRVFQRIEQVAPTDSVVLITGETGTGKELVARAIHKRSNRSARAFVSVNCAAIPTSLIASELFGYEKGAFTGATQRRLGRFELADGGTIFLDEVGELPPETQVALLRVLQERTLERVGGSQSISADVRVLAATNRDLQAAVEAGTFRQDLFYRLNVFPIHMPPLRDRVEDIPLLVEYLTERYASKAGKKIASINKQTLDLFKTYDWPGNIRELQNVLERAVILCDGDILAVDETWLQRELPRPIVATRRLGRAGADQERDLIESALTESRGRVSGPGGAAAKLGIPRSTLESRIRSLQINKYQFKSG